MDNVRSHRVHGRSASHASLARKLLDLYTLGTANAPLSIYIWSCKVPTVMLLSSELHQVLFGFLTSLQQ